MPKKPAKPWFRADRGKYFVTLRGKQIDLGPDKDAAERLFHELLSKVDPFAHRPAAPPSRANYPVLAAIDDFYGWSAENHTPANQEWYDYRLKSWAKHLAEKTPELTLAELAPGHITAWISSHPNWSANYRHGCIRAAQAAIKWYCAEWKLGESPIAGVKKPTPVPREFVFSRDQVDAIFRETDDAFLLFVAMLSMSGARPYEVRTVTAADCRDDCRTWYWDRAKKGKPRIVYLPKPVQEICRTLVSQRPTGPLLLNARGKPWTRNAIFLRMRRLRIKLRLPAGAVAYALRHTFATDALEKGLDVLTVAKLMGHSNTEMLAKVYAHLRDPHLSAAADRAAGR